MTLFQSNKWQSLLTNSVRLLLLTVPEKEEDVMKVSDAAAPMDLSEAAKQAMKMLTGAENSGLLDIRC